MAGPTYVASGGRANDQWYSSGSILGHTLTLTKPTDAAAGDVIVVAIAMNSSYGWATPAGWTLLGSVGTLTALYWRRIAAGDTTWTWNQAAPYNSSLYKATIGCSYIVARGCDETSPVVLPEGAAAHATTLSFSGVTTTRANSLLGLVAVNYSGGSVSALTATAAGFTEVLDTSSNTYVGNWAGHKAIAAAGATGSYSLVYSGSGGVRGLSCIFQPPPAPTVTVVAPAGGPLTGGTAITITGTNFAAGATVDVGGAAATSVVVVSATEITCVTPARTAGAKTVTVTTTAGDGALAGAFTYISTVDADVKLFKAGVPAGDDQADTVTEWPSSPSEVVYGANDSLWGTTLTAAEVNASDFGVGIAATVGTGAQARVSHVEMEIFYSIGGVQDPQSYLAVLSVDADRETARPHIYRLPRSGYSFATDPSLYRGTSDASLYTSRIYHPARYIEKTFRAIEFEAEVSPASSVAAGLQVWAQVDDGNAFQLLDAAGQAATIRADGVYRLFFPRTDAARGKYMRLEFRIPALTGDAVACAVRVRNAVIRCSHRPEVTEEHSLSIMLGPVPTKGEVPMRSERRSPYHKLERLIALAGPGSPPVVLRDELGRETAVHVTGLSYEEVSNRQGEEPALVAHLRYRVTEYA